MTIEVRPLIGAELQGAIEPLAALRIAVGNWDTASTALHDSNLSPREYLGKLIVGPETALGATLAFEPLRTA